MSVRGKRNAVIGVMTVLVCAAVALNWKYSSKEAVNAIQQNQNLPVLSSQSSSVLTSPEFIDPTEEHSSPDGRENAAENPDGGAKILGEATLVSSADTDAAVGSEVHGGTVSGDDIVNEAGVYTGTDYFASARLTRQQARDNAISLLQEAAQQSNADQTIANEASEGIQVLASYTLKEAQIENLVTAKGYADCVAFMGEDAISVVVSTGNGELTPEDVAKITDIAMSETGYPASSVKIMAAD